MGVISPRTAVEIALPSSIDAAKVLNFQLRNGKTAAEIVRDAAQVIGVVNEKLMARYGGLITITEAPYAYYGQGDSSAGKTPESTEFVDPHPVKGNVSGHMLPVHDYKDALAWTPEYLRDAYERQIQVDMQLIADRWENRFDYDWVKRVLTTTENAIGSGYDVGWAIGTGTNVNFIPPQYLGVAFSTSHSHYNGVAGAVSGTTAKTATDANIADMREHGFEGDLVQFVSSTDVASYAAMAGFVQYVPAGVIVTGGSTSAPVYTKVGITEGLPGQVFGYYTSLGGLVELRSHPRFPTGYAWMTRSFGVNNPKNGVAVREHPAVGFGMYADPQLTNSINPRLDKILFHATHGIGVNDRLNGVASYIGNATYASPTIS